MNTAAAYLEVERITREQARNFAWGIRLLPPGKRRALSAVYAFARRIDDIGDGELAPEAKLTQLMIARQQLSPARAPGDDPVLVALFDAARRFPLPLGAFTELIDGCESDVRGERYDSYPDLLGYCRDVAGSIGRLSLAVFSPELTGAGADRATDLADTLGLALQLTNILRDVREDLLGGRIYLPRQDLERFGCELRLMADGTLDPQHGALAEVVRFQAARAGDLYDRGLQLLPLLDRRSRACCAAMAGIYRHLLDAIAGDPNIIRGGRATLSAATKARIAARALLP